MKIASGLAGLTVVALLLYSGMEQPKIELASSNELLEFPELDLES